jgi:hypothetical protein
MGALRILPDRRLSVAARFQAADGPPHAERGGKDQANRQPIPTAKSSIYRGGFVLGNGSAANPELSKFTVVGATQCKSR